MENMNCNDCIKHDVCSKKSDIDTSCLRLIPRSQKNYGHKFWTLSGMIFERI